MTLLDDLARAAPFTQPAPAAPGFQPFQFLMPPAVPDAPAAQPPTAAPAAPPAVTTTPPFSTVPPLPQLAQQQQAGQPAGVVLPPEALSPQPMSPQLRQFRLRPATTGAAQPAPPDAKPPAKPPPERYIRTFPRKPNSWGTDDAVLAGIGRHPGAGPYLPAEHEYASVLDEAGGFLRQWGSGFTGMMALAMGMYSNGYQKAFKARQLETARLNLINFQRAAKEVVFRQDQESREYAEAFAAYGPSKEKPNGDPAALDNAIRVIAGKYNDTKIPAILNTGGIPAVERAIAALDARSKDIEKTLRIASIRQVMRDRDQRYEAGEAKKRAAQQAEAGFSAGAPAPTAPPVTSGGDREWHSQADVDAAREGAAPAAAPTDQALDEVPAAVPQGATAETPDAETSAETPETSAETPETEKTAAATPAETPARTAETPPSAPQRPIRLAQAATGTATDAPSLAESAGRGEAGGGEDEGLIPKPVKTTREPPIEAAPPVARPAAAAQPRPEERPGEPEPKSKKMARDYINLAGQPMPLDWDAVDGRAQRMVNGTMKLEEQKMIPKGIQNIDYIRKGEIEREMDRIIADPKITGQQVFTELGKYNRELSADLKAYVKGDFPVPTSSWNNRTFLNRLIALGTKADPGFNEFTAKTRAATYKDAAVGKIAQGLTYTATAYRHIHHVLDLLAKRPEGYLQRALANYDTPQWLNELAKLTPEDREIMGALQNAVNTANSEYERALVGGRPTVHGRAAQNAELPLVIGNTKTMLANMRDKETMLRDRLDEIENQFLAGSGSQPTAMLNRFKSAGELSERQRDAANLELLRQGAVIPASGPPGVGTKPAGKTGEVDFRDFFGVQ